MRLHLKQLREHELVTKLLDGQAEEQLFTTYKKAKLAKETGYLSIIFPVYNTPLIFDD